MNYTISLNAPLAASAATVTPGVVVSSTNGSAYTTGTADKVNIGVALTSGSANQAITICNAGLVPAAITGLGAGAASYVTADPTTGVLSRVLSPAQGSFVIGTCNANGDLFVHPQTVNNIATQPLAQLLSKAGASYIFDGTNVTQAFHKSYVSVLANDPQFGGLKPNDPTYDNGPVINAAIQEAARRANALGALAGGVVVLDAGTYYVRTTIVLDGGATGGGHYSAAGVALLGGSRNGSSGASLTTRLIWNGTTAKSGTAATVSAIDNIAAKATVGGLGGLVSSADVGKILWLNNPATAANIGGWQITDLVDSSTVKVAYRQVSTSDTPPVAGDTNITWSIPEKDVIQVLGREMHLEHITIGVATQDYSGASPCCVRAGILDTWSLGGGVTALCTQNSFKHVRCSTEGFSGAVMIFGLIHGDSLSTPMQGSGPANCDEMYYDRCYFGASYAGFWNGNTSGQSKNHKFHKCTFDGSYIPANSKYYAGCVFSTGNVKFEGCTFNACSNGALTGIVDFVVFEDCEEENCPQLYRGPGSTSAGSWSSNVTFRGGRYSGLTATTARPYIELGGNSVIYFNFTQFDASRNANFRIALGNSPNPTKVVAVGCRFPYELPFVVHPTNTGAVWTETLIQCVYVDGGGASQIMPDRLNAPSNNGWTYQGYGFNWVPNGQLAQQGNNVALANGANVDVAHTGYGLLRVTGPSAAFSISGFLTPQSDWAQLTVWVTVNQQCTIKNEDAAETTAARRITTRTGADVVIAGQAGGILVSFVYDPNTSRWIYTGSR